MPSPLLSTNEVAVTLDVSPSSVLRLVACGKLNPAHKGNGVRGPMFFRPADVAKIKGKN